MNDRITALEQALNKINGITEASFPGATSAVDVAEIQRTARAALAASRAAPDCHQPDLVTAAQVRINPLVWDEYGTAKSGGAKYCIYKFGSHGLWNAVCYPHEDTKYRLAEKVTQEAAKAAAQADYDARILAALDLTPAPAVEPVALTYTNWRGQTAVRRIVPLRVWFGSTAWHPEPQWLLTAIDMDKGFERDFALAGFGQPVTAQDAARVLLSWWNSNCISDARVIVCVCEALRNHTEDQWQQFDAALRAIGGDA